MRRTIRKIKEIWNQIKLWNLLCRYDQTLNKNYNKQEQLEPEVYDMLRRNFNQARALIVWFKENKRQRKKNQKVDKLIEDWE